MNREIKFRIWDKEHREILGWDIVEKEGTLEWLSYDLFCVMQYTGLDDKNGVEIYEGDIVTHRFPYDKRFKNLSVVIYGDYQASFVLDQKVGKILSDEQIPLYKVTADMYLEILGNIYENKELLNV